MKKLIFINFIGFAGLLLLTACSSKSDETQPANGGEGRMGNFAGQSSAAIPVQVAAVRRGNISTFLLQTTTIEAEKEVEILAKVSGQVVKLAVEEGDRVKAGDLLVQLDEAEIRIDYIQAKIKMETDKAVYERAKEMLEQKLIAEENYETSRLQYESSKSACDAAKLKLDYTSVPSPIDGVVTIRNVELGQRVNVNQVLFRVADFKPLRAKIYVPEKDMAKVYQNQKAKITVESEKGLAITGIVKMISPVVDPTSGTAKVTIDIENDKGKLKPGMFASVYINTETHSNTLLIPKKALIIESEEDQVYKNEDGLATKVKLDIGFVAGDTVEVLSGLKEGDLVVTVGQEGLRTGLPIKIPGEELKITRMEAKESETTSGQVAANAGEFGQRQEQGMGMWGDGAPDPERLKMMSERLLQNPEVRKEYEKRIKADPDFANNPEKKQAFFREMFRKMRSGQGGGFPPN